MMACCKLPASREFKLAIPGQQRRRHPDAPRQLERQNAPFGRGTGGHTGDRVGAPIGGDARVLDVEAGSLTVTEAEVLSATLPVKVWWCRVLVA
jgi:hypothetical protein